MGSRASPTNIEDVSTRDHNNPTTTQYCYTPSGNTGNGIDAIERTRSCSSASVESNTAAAAAETPGAGEQASLGIAMEPRSPRASSSSSPAAAAAPSRLSGRRDRNGKKPPAAEQPPTEREQGEAAAAVAAPLELSHRPPVAPPPSVDDIPPYRTQQTGTTPPHTTKLVQRICKAIRRNRGEKRQIVRSIEYAFRFVYSCLWYRAV